MKKTLLCIIAIVSCSYLLAQQTTELAPSELLGKKSESAELRSFRKANSKHRKSYTLDYDQNGELAALTVYSKLSTKHEAYKGKLPYKLNLNTKYGALKKALGEPTQEVSTGGLRYLCYERDTALTIKIVVSETQMKVWYMTFYRDPNKALLYQIPELPDCNLIKAPPILDTYPCELCNIIDGALQQSLENLANLPADTAASSDGLFWYITKTPCTFYGPIDFAYDTKLARFFMSTVVYSGESPEIAHKLYEQLNTKLLDCSKDKMMLDFHTIQEEPTDSKRIVKVQKYQANINSAIAANSFKNIWLEALETRSNNGKSYQVMLITYLNPK